MVSGSDLRDFYINAWRNIPEIVTAMGGDDGAIRGSAGISRIAKSLQREVTGMPAPSIYVAYQGFKAGPRGRSIITLHDIAAYIRASTTEDDENIQFGELMLNGIPTGSDLPVMLMSMSVDVDPLDSWRFERVSASELTIDIWKLSFTVAETAG